MNSEATTSLTEGVNELGIIEQWGSGIQRIILTCKSEGFPEPLFEELATHFRVTFFMYPEKPLKFDKVDKSILNFLEEDQGLSTSEIAKKIALSTRATRTRLTKLIARGYVIEIASSPQDPNLEYYLTKKKLS